MNRPKQIGTQGENAAVAYYREHLFPVAERRALHGTNDMGDIAGTPGLCTQVKAGHAAEAASDSQIRTWLQELDVQAARAGASAALLVRKKKGYGTRRVGLWHAHMWASQLYELSYAAAYGHEYTGKMPEALDTVPVEVLFEEAVGLLKAAGYGGM